MKTKFKCLMGLVLFLFVICTLCSCQCAHKWQDATCTAPATCTLCGETKGEATGHSYSESVSKQPTCSTSGTKLYACTACDDSYTEPINKLEHTVTNGICDLCSEIIKGGSVMQEKSPLCSYTAEADPKEGGTDALYIYIPTGEGYIRYQFIHTKQLENRNANTWRLGYVVHVDDAFENERLITDPGAEWEMAVKLKDRVDFIGGLAHGDEIFHTLTLTSDGEERSINKMDFVPFDTLTIEVYSTGYDPNVKGREVLSHYKKLIFTEDGVRVEQRVEFKTDEVSDTVYFAMMPPRKEYTDSYYTNLDAEGTKHPTPKNPVWMRIVNSDLNSVTLTGEDGYSFRMTVEKYNAGNKNFIISDNSGNSYNKMYFLYGIDGKTITAGDVIETVTVYQIAYNK